MLSPTSRFTINIIPLIFATSGPVTNTIANYGSGINGFDANNFAFTGQFNSTPVIALTGGGTTLTLTFTPVPEPAHNLVVGAGAAGLLGWFRRRFCRV